MNHTKRRELLKKKLAKNSLLILASGEIIPRTVDALYPFHVSNNFYYMTGLREDNINLVINMITGEEVIFLDENDPIKIKWDARKYYPEEAAQISGVSRIEFSDKFAAYLEKYAPQAEVIYLDLDEPGKPMRLMPYFRVYQQLNELGLAERVENIYDEIVSLRTIKDEDELAKIQRSIDVTNSGLKRVMSNLRPGLKEYQMQIYFDSAIKFLGNHPHSFDTISSGGKNATILHYTKADGILKDGDLALFDLGCETDGYASDISRTYPINGKFSPRQKEIYEAVLDINLKCIDYLRPGLTWRELNDYANKLSAEWQMKLGLITKPEDFRQNYWHSIGHPVGLDVHDPADRSVPLAPGMVITIEPGLYNAKEGIGVRIEDNVLITEGKAICMSGHILKDVAGIEKYMAENKKHCTIEE